MSKNKITKNNIIQQIIDSRKNLQPYFDIDNLKKREVEGGCGVVGFISTVPVSGRHIHRPSIQMHNRGNGKGGGIAVMGLEPRDLGVSRDILDDTYILQIAYLNIEVKEMLEEKFINPIYDISHIDELTHIDDYRDIEGLDVKPPDICRYFVRVKKDILRMFKEDNELRSVTDLDVEEEFIYRNSYEINRKYYASGDEQHAFVLSHGKDIIVLKLVGYAEHIVEYYQLMNFKAHIWIAHQRYPTKGKVWHPGGAHPFVGLNTALVHNGDFANYHSITEYLAQRNIHSLFLTDTEVSILLFDLFSRTYKYPLEYVIEALAPTTERDFEMLSPDKREIYRRIQTYHIQSSPDGPWFFIIARNDTKRSEQQLIGITDTSMLRPQVFALQKGEVEIGLIASEKQAIDATLESLFEEDDRFLPVADRYWNARGGSHTDGGAFIFSIKGEDDKKALSCTDKFGEEVEISDYDDSIDMNISADLSTDPGDIIYEFERLYDRFNSNDELIQYIINHLGEMDYSQFKTITDIIVQRAGESDKDRDMGIEVLTKLIDERFPLARKRRGLILTLLNDAICRLFSSISPISKDERERYNYIDYNTRDLIRKSEDVDDVLVINTRDFAPEGHDSLSYLIVSAYKKGWKRFICYGFRGQRFCGCGLGSNTEGMKIDVYGSSGDYLASGIDGLEMYIHGNAQDQLGQIMKRGKLVVYGDVGQTFMYGAKGGEVYILGNAAGRPLINAVGRPRVVINGTCLDYLAESFMAGDPLNGGGFVILNGVKFNEDGQIVELRSSYPGGNLFSLASGGAIYVRDPHQKLDESQLNGGVFATLTDEDWSLIKPYLKENERLFGISVERLLTVDDYVREPSDIYRVVKAVKLSVLTGKDE